MTPFVVKIRQPLHCVPWLAEWQPMCALEVVGIYVTKKPWFADSVVMIALFLVFKEHPAHYQHQHHDDHDVDEVNAAHDFF